MARKRKRFNSNPVPSDLTTRLMMVKIRVEMMVTRRPEANPYRKEATKIAKKKPKKAEKPPAEPPTETKPKYPKGSISAALAERRSKQAGAPA